MVSAPVASLPRSWPRGTRERFFEPFTTLSWLAGITTRVRLGTTVLVLPYRHPLLVARMAAATSTSSSGGRLALGVGAGSGHEQQFEALGVSFIPSVGPC